MAAPEQHIEDVEAFNDELAKNHDIDDYYGKSSLPIRVIEKIRLAQIKSLVGARRGDRILEVGCGGGHVLRQFPEAELTGVDVSSVMLDKAKKNLAGYKATLLKGELDELDLEEHSFDAIICTEVLEHVVDPESVLRGIERLVRRDGRVVITFPNDTLIEQLKGMVIKMGLSKLLRVEWGGDHFHLHIWSIDEMRALLSKYFRVADERFAPTRLMPVRCCFGCRPR